MAALCLVAMLGVIVVQMIARWSSFTFPGATDYAGYLMAAASFLAFAGALNSGAHIRVGLFLNALGERRYWGELWCLLVGTAATLFLSWYAIRLVYWSWKLNDVSQGQDATPLWIVQIPVAFGAGLLAVAFVDNLITLILTGRDNIRDNVAVQSHAE
ncbi:TRAP transporter small permease [Defluviimonas aestuarii]|uniref:TRAP transporter small permease n=1 Tax=Albidovulum aestuarii TaxID=1130726 RepID=UPI00249C6CEB|nr:TRAP transporter small permease [Defluviimonas aestuarii]MDI3336200.1 TRAP transporter small permease [Defluviimonas aestuarii]